MSNFFKFTFASCLGVLLSTVVLFLIGAAAIGRMVQASNPVVKLRPNTILHLQLERPIPEKTNNKAVDNFALDTEDIVGLQDMVRTLAYAKTDDNVKGIFLDLTGATPGNASASVLRRALIDFKESGKFIVAWSEYYTQGTYYLASIADKIYLLPTGGMDFRGYSPQIPFLRDMLERLGINMQVYYAGQFKSATEPFRLYKMSEQNRLQVREYLEGLYGQFLQDIAEARDLDPYEVRRLADEFLLRTPADAVRYGMVDAEAYYDEALQDIRDRIGLEEKDKLRRVDLEKYYSVAHTSQPTDKDRIAVVYAEGDIVMGKGEVGNIGGDRYAKIIRRLRQDKKVKAIVLRINSPGGSCMASDMIWREIELAKEAGITVVASMGDVAASGGYYIAANADAIYAEPNTITGSIGVFGLIPSIHEMLKDKVGIEFDSVKTGPYATAYTPFFDATPAEGKVMQSLVENFYDIFLDRVAEGRQMSRDEVHKVAQGRVWTGARASQIGLVDDLGSLDDAIAAAAEKAELDSYRIREYPLTKNPLQQYVDKFTGMDEQTKAHLFRSELGDLYPYYQQISAMKDWKGVQARLPFTLEY